MHHLGGDAKQERQLAKGEASLFIAMDAVPLGKLLIPWLATLHLSSSVVSILDSRGMVGPAGEIMNHHPMLQSVIEQEIASRGELFVSNSPSWSNYSIYVHIW